MGVEGEITNEKIEQVILEKTGETVSINEKSVFLKDKMVTLSALKSEVRFL